MSVMKAPKREAVPKMFIGISHQRSSSPLARPPPAVRMTSET